MEIKYNWQLYTLNTFAKIGLLLAILGYSLFIDNNYFSIAFYHFITLYGVICFSLSLYFEYKKFNLILSFFSILGIIAYQPFFFVLIEEKDKDYVRPNDIVLILTVFLGFIWIIFDIVRWIIDFKKSKN